jgi:hypothetical protein
MTYITIGPIHLLAASTWSVIPQYSQQVSPFWRPSWTYIHVHTERVIRDQMGQLVLLPIVQRYLGCGEDWTKTGFKV